MKWSSALKDLPLVAGMLGFNFAAFGQSDQGPAKPVEARPAVSAPAAHATSRSAASAPAPLALTVKQIVEKNVAARGGLTAWRAVGSMVESGKIEDSGNVVAPQPFVLMMKRPRKSRLELVSLDQKAVQVYDGQNGWKLRAWQNRVEPYTAAELERAVDQQELDGPLIDCAAKGTKVEYEGIEQVEGHDAYKLKLTLIDNHVRHIWIDTKSFLDVKIEAAPRVMYGRERQAMTYFRDYRPVNGLMIPHTLETTVEGINQTRKVTIVKVVLNPKLDDSAFAKPGSFAPAAAMRRGAAPAPFGAPPAKR